MNCDFNFKRKISFNFFQALKPKHPIYPCINIQIKGYDFAVLETYQRYLHRIANNFDLDVSEW